MLIPSGRVMLSASVSGNASALPHPAQSTPRPSGRCGYRHLNASLLLSHAAHAPRQRLTQACVPGRPDGLRGVEHPAGPAGTLDFFPPSTAPHKLFPTATHPAIVQKRDGAKTRSSNPVAKQLSHQSHSARQTTSRHPLPYLAYTNSLQDSRTGEKESVPTHGPAVMELYSPATL